MLTLDVNLLLCRDDDFSNLAVKSFHETYLKEGIKKFVSVSRSNYESIFEEVFKI